MQKYQAAEKRIIFQLIMVLKYVIRYRFEQSRSFNMTIFACNIYATSNSSLNYAELNVT